MQLFIIIFALFLICTASVLLTIQWLATRSARQHAENTLLLIINYVPDEDWIPSFELFFDVILNGCTISPKTFNAALDVLGHRHFIESRILKREEAEADKIKDAIGILPMKEYRRTKKFNKYVRERSEAVNND